MVFLDFEKPIEELILQLDQLQSLKNKGDVDMTQSIKDLKAKIKAKQKEVYSNLNGWQKVQVSRHPERPYSLYYLNEICDEFVELHGDRQVKDDKAIVAGLGTLDGESVVFIGHQKGVNTKMRQFRNFGMPNPEGYRKALRIMKLAEKFNRPVVTFIDTPGAFPGLEAEERGQAEAIARNLFEMAQLKVPILCIVIGEGASGGALGIGLGDRVLMMENTWYSVISPESCSSILWRTWDHKEKAAEALKLTADHMKSAKLIDGIVKEPLGGAHRQPKEAAELLKKAIQKHLSELKEVPTKALINQRVEKYAAIGHFDKANS